MLDSNPWYLLVDSVTISLNVQALRTSDDASNPVYVSVGHKVSLETATQLVIACSIELTTFSHYSATLYH